jgi:trans-aconitate methyltransferase
MTERHAHWDNIYQTKPANSVSWFQPSARPSLDMIRAAGIERTTPIIDVGGGASVLVDELLDAGFADVTVLDIASPALAVSQQRLGSRELAVHWIAADILAWQPERSYGLWHDRAAFHFLTEAQDRLNYRDTVERALSPGGWLILATFAEDGPERCSGLPVHRWSAEALAAEWGSGFELIQIAREEHVTPWGAAQAFTWCRFKRIT